MITFKCTCFNYRRLETQLYISISEHTSVTENPNVLGKTGHQMMVPANSAFLAVADISLYILRKLTHLGQVPSVLAQVQPFPFFPYVPNCHKLNQRQPVQFTAFTTSLPNNVPDLRSEAGTIVIFECGLGF